MWMEDQKMKIVMKFNKHMRASFICSNVLNGSLLFLFEISRFEMTLP